MQYMTPYKHAQVSIYFFERSELAFPHSSGVIDFYCGGQNFLEVADRSREKLPAAARPELPPQSNKAENATIKLYHDFNQTSLN
jgi:hypothetical protein